MSSPVFRESDVAVRGEEHTAGSYQPAACGHLVTCCLLRAACCAADVYIVHGFACCFLFGALLSLSALGSLPYLLIGKSMATALNTVSLSPSVEQRRDYFTVLAAMEPAPPDTLSSGYVFSKADSGAGSEEPL